MKEILDDVARWRADGHRVAIARVVGVEGSGPRDPGATMVVNDAGEVAGSVSGGCVEGAVVEAALAVLAGEQDAGDRELRVLRRRGLRGRAHVRWDDPPLRRTARLVSRDRDATCPRPPVFDALADALRRRPADRARDRRRGSGHRRQAARANPAGPWSGTLGNADLDRVVARDALAELGAGLTSTRHYGEHGEARERAVGVFIECFAPPPRMIIFGAVDFTAALARVAKLLGYRVTVCDARAVFATPARFPMADDVVNDWPDRYLESVEPLGPRDAVCVLTHDAKFDVPAIVARARDRGGLPGCDGFAPHPRDPSRSGCGKRASTMRGLARVDGPDRPRHRLPHPRGNRGRHLRRDHRPAHRPHRRRLPPRRPWRNPLIGEPRCRDAMHERTAGVWT